MLKHLLKAIREFKIQTILTPIMICVEVVLEVFIPTITARLIDDGIEMGSMPDILKIGTELVVYCLASLLFAVVAADLSAKASAGFAKNLRHDMYYNVQRYSFANIDRFSTSSIVTRLTTDITNVQNSFQMCIRIAVRAPVMLIFALVMAFRVNSRLACVYLGVIPVLGVGMFLIIRYAHPIFVRVFKKYDALNNVVQENLHGIRVVKSFVREEREIEKFNAVSEDIYSDFSKAERMLAFNAPLMQACVSVCMLVISWFSAKLIVASGNDPSAGMTTGDLTSLITYTMQILMNLMMLSMVFVMLTISKASAERIVEILAEEPTFESPAEPIGELEDGSVIFNNVSFSYAGDSNKLCLSDITLEIHSGETIGIIGGTGSSKTTLVQLIPRLYDVTVGQIMVGGHDVREYDLNTLRDSVGMVLQKNVMFSGTISENLRWGCADADDDELRRICALAQADGFINEFPDGYETHIEQGGSNVSGGQRQRLCIARALLKKPKILILDDSTSAVDTKTDALLRRAFKTEIPDTTKIIIAQRIASIQDADKIIVLEGGKLNGFGTHAELLADNEIYREVYYSQIKGGADDEQ